MVKYVFLCSQLFSSPMRTWSGHAGIVLTKNLRPVASFGIRNSNWVVYDSAGFSGLIREVPLVDGGTYVRRELSMTRTSRGAGVRDASLGRSGDVVVSSNRVRRVMV